jgi:hypothetical protein
MTLQRDYLLTSELPKSTIWGTPDTGRRYGEGVILVNTPGHGGFILSPEVNAKVHSAWRTDDRCYEEDSDWSIVAITFPEMFTEAELVRAHVTARNWMPHQYMEATGAVVTPEESSKLRLELLAEQNKDKLVVTSAIGRGDLVKVTATIGGDRSLKGRTFMVPKDEYKRIEGGFVVDPARHPEIVD